MLISTSRRFIFAANTKTASTSIEHVLTPYSDIVYDGEPAIKHMPLVAARQRHPELFDAEGDGGFFRFGVMRDPLDWIASWYRYRSGNEVESPLPSDMTFADFWERKDWNILHPNGRGKYLQSDIFCDAEGAVLADVILPYHTLEPVFFEICDHLGVARTLPRKNVSRNAGDTSVIPQNLQEEVRAFYEDDYALLDSLDALNAAGLDRLRAMAA